MQTQINNIAKLAVVIPTYNRGEILLSMIQLLFSQTEPADEILIIDQTVYQNGDPVQLKLKELAECKSITWVQLTKPSIPVAMNRGLVDAKSDFVLFLDDDVTFDMQFIESHRLALGRSNCVAHVGQILQPNESSVTRGSNYQSGAGLWRDLAFPFRSDTHASVHNCMAGNLLVNRQIAIQCGGFDEQFSGAAYRFETEFCRRLIEYTKTPFQFIPSASLNHLKVSSGGTRDQASNFLSSSSPHHSQGDYYFALKSGQNSIDIFYYVCSRLIGCLFARFYLRKPWWIPVRIVGEIRGLILAIYKIKQGSKLIS